MLDALAYGRVIRAHGIPTRQAYQAINKTYSAVLNHNPKRELPEDYDTGWAAKLRVIDEITGSYETYYDSIAQARAYPLIQDRAEMVSRFADELMGQQIDNFDRKKPRLTLPADLKEKAETYRKESPYSGNTVYEVIHYNNQSFIKVKLPRLKNDLRAFITKKYPNTQQAIRHARKILGELGFDEEKINLTIAVIERK
ncbi:MAG: hypothetical protein PF961_23510 [Planctomycetota bacterium]|jgi:hypothetical protein|nr:hypothetical protein [Planctomycetota bacterium]